jgi:hypothetical protein
MCLPAAAAVPLMIASTAVSAFGQIAQGVQARAQGKYEAQVDKMNEGLAVESYRDSRTAGQQKATDFWRSVAQTKGQQIAAMAANGIDVDFGSAARLQSDTQMLANEDASRLYLQNEEEAKGHLIDASNYASGAKAARARGSAAFTNSIFGAAATTLGGLSQAGALKAKIAPGP